MRIRIMGVILTLALFLGSQGPAFAALAASSASPGASDATEINNMTPGSSKTFLGTRLRGPLATGSTTFAADENGQYAVGSDPATTPTTTVFLKTTGSTAGESYYLGDGQQNQRLTIVLTTDGGTNFTVTPVTKSGFTSVQLDDANDSVTLRFINSTVGWVIDGNAGATIN